ncbi:exosome complex exonuclease Rrp41, partial [archaeon]|nr:exosome complex exonuclease Rrp41 [archaeon]
MSGSGTLNVEDYIKKGKRADGRDLTGLRPLKIKAHVLPRADGSCYLEWGQNKVLAGVFGPKEVLPRHLSNPLKGLIKFQYRMAGFSVPDRKNPRPGRREVEISKVCGEALEKAVLLEKYPNTMIDVFVEILDSNAGSRVAALTAASVALADAGIPMNGLVSAVSVGKIAGHAVVDLTKHEEDAPDAVDIPIGVLPNTNEVVLLQLDGLISMNEFKQCLKNGIEAVQKVHDIQKNALLEKYLPSAQQQAKNEKSVEAAEGREKPK